MLLKAGSGLHYSCDPNFFNQLMSLGRFEVFIITAQGLVEGGRKDNEIMFHMLIQRVTCSGLLTCFMYREKQINSVSSWFYDWQLNLLSQLSRKESGLLSQTIASCNAAE